MLASLLMFVKYIGAVALAGYLLGEAIYFFTKED